MSTLATIKKKTLSTFKPYPKYKDSGIEWLGEIPEGWEVIPLKRVFHTLNGSTPKSSEADYWDGDIPWATPDDLGSMNGDTLHETQRMITAEGYGSCGTSLAPAGSLILSTRAPIGHLAVAGQDMCTNQGCRSLVFKRNDTNRYYYYLILSAKKELQSLGQGSTFKELGRSKLESIGIVDIDIEDQTAIASFLDRETSRIDTLISKKERQIELLQEKRSTLISHAVTKGLDPDVKMKDSGVEWLGEIPEGWKALECKFGYEIQLGKMLQNEPQSIYDENFPYLKALYVQWENVNVDDLPHMWASPSDIDKYSVVEGDLLVCEGGEVGRAGILYNPPNKCIIQNAVHRVRPKGDNSNKYLMYVLEVASYRGWFDILCNKATIAHFTGEKFGWLPISLPPAGEQLSISSFLDSETSRIDMIIEKVKTSIEKLREYRTALISAAVTGKIDVREEEAI